MRGSTAVKCGNKGDWLTRKTRRPRLSEIDKVLVPTVQTNLEREGGVLPKPRLHLVAITVLRFGFPFLVSEQHKLKRRGIHIT